MLFDVVQMTFTGSIEVRNSLEIEYENVKYEILSKHLDTKNRFISWEWQKKLISSREIDLPKKNKTIRTKFHRNSNWAGQKRVWKQTASQEIVGILTECDRLMRLNYIKEFIADH